MVTFTERLHVPWWWLLLGLAMVASLAIVVVAYVPNWLGIVFTMLTSVAVFTGLGLYSFTTVSVDETMLRAGRYRLERRYIAAATVLQGTAAADALGANAEHRAFLFTRPYLRDLVRVDVADPADPHPCWLISTRHAERLAAALETQP